MAADATVEIVGMNALAGDLARMSNPGGTLDSALSDAARRVLEPKAATARAAIPHVTGAMAASVQVAAQPYGAVLSEGDGIAYAGFVDFGGNRPQSGPRPYLPTGRYLFPAAGDLTQPVVTAFEQSLQSSFDRYGWTNTTDNPGVVHE